METQDSVSFLGYEFFLFTDNNGKTIRIKYGNTKEKKKKYNNRIDSLILCYKNPKSPDFKQMELLRHRIAAFSSREVYLTKHFRKNVWRVKGFISNYGELRYLLDTKLVEENTEHYLKNMISEAFDRAGMPRPYFLKGSGYNLYENMKSNKTILLVEQVGYDYKALANLCKKIRINNTDANGKRHGYNTLVRNYLIKVRVGY